MATKKPAKKPPAKAAPKKAAPAAPETAPKAAWPFTDRPGPASSGAGKPVVNPEIPALSWSDGDEGQTVNPLGVYAQDVDALGSHNRGDSPSREPLQNPTPKNARLPK